MKTNKQTIFRLTLLSLFIAVMAVMNFTPLGYITTGAFSITLMTIPVALGAACGGMWGGAVLGTVFGLTSFLQAFGIGFMIDPMAAILFGENPFYYTVTCFAPRILAGLLSGLVIFLIENRGVPSVVSFALSAAVVPVVNTVGFLSLYILFYKETVLGEASVMTILTTALLLNFAVELLVTVIASTAINKPVYSFTKKLAKQ